jgi:hypothetical protein
LQHAFLRPTVITSQNVVIQESSIALRLPSLRRLLGGSRARAGKGKLERSPDSATGARSRTGLVFSGAQKIVSVVPHADNKIQTVRQPDIPKLRLKMPFAARNILQVASASLPVLAPQPFVVEVNKKNNLGRRQAIHVQPQGPAVTARLNLPLSGDSINKAFNRLSGVQSAAPRLERRQPASRPVTGPGSDMRNLLVLNALPSQSTQVTIPAGELSGEFIVAPLPVTGTGLAVLNEDRTGPNSENGSGSGTQAGTSGNIKSGRDSARPDPGQGVDGGSGSGGVATRDSGKGTDNGPTPAGGRGNDRDPKADVEMGSAPFSGISIAEAEPPANPPPPRVATPHGLYGMTIIATGSSGGGLKDYGIFRNETVYTVYVDMAETGHTRPNWTLQYSAPGGSSQAISILVPPFPSTREYPRLPRDATLRNLGRTMVVSGFITRD